MCGGKFETWVTTQRTHYKSFKEGKYNTMTAERIELLKAISLHFL